MNADPVAYPYRILVVDNLEVLVDATRNRLESAGYHVETATTLDDADDLMHGRYFHVAVLDIRMMGGDPNDWTGIELAERCRFPETKIMFSSFVEEEPEYASRVLRIDDKGRATARELVNKNFIDDPEKGLLAKLADVIARHVRINHALNIHNPSGWSFLAAAQRIVPTAPAQQILDYAQQLEDLFRRHFCDEQQITLYPLPVRADGREWLYVEALPASGNVHRFIIVCGLRKIVSHERDQHQAFARSSRWRGHVSYRETIHCALNAYHLVEHVAQPQSWSQIPLDQWPVDALRHLPDAVIRVDQQQPPVMVDDSLLSVALGSNELSDELPVLIRVVNQIATNCRYHFPELVSFKSDGLFGFVHLPEVPAAVISRAAGVLLCRRTTQRPVTTVHGALDADHLLYFAGSDELAVIDYTTVRRASVLHDYVALDWSLRLEITRYLRLDECFTAMLYALGEGELPDDPAMRDAVESVHAVRLVAQNTLGGIACDDVAYTSELVAHGVRCLLQYPRHVPLLTRAETARYAQALFVTLLACGRLLPPAALRQPLWLDENGEFWSLTGVIDLTDTSRNLLRLLYDNAGQLVSYEQLFRHGLKASTYDSTTDRGALQTPVSRLRAQLEGVPVRIEPQRGEDGYILAFDV